MGAVDSAPRELSLFRRIKRTRLSGEQRAILEHAYDRHAERKWTTAEIRSLASRLGVRHTKVYKWCYDRLRKGDIEDRQPFDDQENN